MAVLHRTLLDHAVLASAPWAERLKYRSILVTGGSGFLASNLIAFLQCLSEHYHLKISLSASARRSSAEVPLFEFLGLTPPTRWEIADVEQTTVAAEPNLTVVHTASYGSPRDYMSHPFETFESNTRGLVNLFQRSADAGASQFVYFSSAEIYGQPSEDNIPTPEGYVGGLSTTDSRSIYGESKRMAEVLGTVCASRTAIPMTIIRPWNLYGPGQRIDDGRVPVEFVRQAMVDGGIRLLSNGSPRRAFCFVWDGIAQIASLLGGCECTDAWNVGNGEAEISILETARCCVEQCGLLPESLRYNAAAEAPGMQRCCPNVERVLRHMNITTPHFTPLQTGIESVVQWLQFLKVRP